MTPCGTSQSPTRSRLVHLSVPLISDVGRSKLYPSAHSTTKIYDHRPSNKVTNTDRRKETERRIHYSPSMTHARSSPRFISFPPSISSHTDCLSFSSLSRTRASISLSLSLTVHDTLILPHGPTNECTNVAGYPAPFFVHALGPVAHVEWLVSTRAVLCCFLESHTAREHHAPSRRAQQYSTELQVMLIRKTNCMCYACSQP